MAYVTNGAHRSAAERLAFPVLLVAMVALYALSWPNERSLDMWVFKDRSSFLNLEYMLDQHLRLGIDAYYSYGLLPVFIQHALFAVFGRGLMPLVGAQATYVVLAAIVWCMIIRALPDPRQWLVAVLLLCPVILWINPNLPYVPVQLSMLFAVAFILRRRLDLALVVAAIGCWSVPTVNLVFAGLLFVFIILDWYSTPGRRVDGLVRTVAPGVLTYLAVGALLGATFGWGSVLMTVLPIRGIVFYRTIHYGLFTTLREFLLPGPDRLLRGGYLRYYLCDRATWWLFSTVLLTVFSLIGLRRMWQSRTVQPAALVVVLCAATQLAFAFFAYGEVVQHGIYDPIVVAGIMVALGFREASRSRTVLLALFLGLGALSSIDQAAYTFWKWRHEAPDPQAHGLYATPDFAQKWSAILGLAQGGHSVFFLSYGTGIHHYFPTLDSPAVWTLQVGQLLPGDRARILDGMRRAEFVVEDLTGPTRLFALDPDISAQLASLCRRDSNEYFIVYSHTGC